MSLALKRRSLPLAALALVATALLLPGCGGGDEEQASTATRAQQETTAAPRQKPNEEKKGSQRNAGSKQPSGQAGGGSNSSEGPVPGAKSAAPGVPIVRGGDNSIQVFGVEGETSQSEQAIATLEAYLNALRAGEWSRACAATSSEFKQELATMIARARARGDARKPKGCATTLRQLFADAPKAALRAAAQVNEVLSFRVEGEYAYIIFKGAEGAVRFIAMASDDGEWKVNTLEPTEFPGGP